MYLLCIFIFIHFSCSSNGGGEENVVARVNETALTKEQLSSLAGSAVSDSRVLLLATNRWIEKTLLYNEAIKSGNVDEEAKKQFLKGADIAYEQIITAFAKGDKKSLKNLLAKSMFNRFSDVIDERKKKELIYETVFIGIKSAKVLEFKKVENIYKVSVDFVSEIITCVKDKNDKVIEGNPDMIKTVNDEWKFSKNMWSQNPNWYLVDTSN